MSTFRSKYISFDCYGTLIHFRMGEMARELFPDRIPAQQMWLDTAPTFDGATLEAGRLGQDLPH